MKSLRGLLYPAGFVHHNTLIHLARFFSALTVLVPTEEADDGKYCSETDVPVVVNAVAPAPLGDRIEEFNSMIRTWEGWAGDLGLGRDDASSALLDSTIRDMESSVQSILQSLKGPEKTDPLMEARFFLKLALEYDRRQDSLAMELAALSGKESRIDSIMKGPETAPLERSARVPQSSSRIEPLHRARQRMKAWTVLWKELTDTGLCPVGETIEVKDMLDQAYELLEDGSSVVDLLTLPLPLDPSAGPVDDSGETMDSLINLVRLILEAGRYDVSGESEINRLADRIAWQWNNRLQAQETGPVLSLVLYPGRSWEEVLICACDTEDVKASNPDQTGWSFFVY
ncbi:MAG TPA: hypothetical protein EYP57_10570 [Thermodesulfobacteriaceae bacterium]|nr:hypothetical protein [Thermodesulfobacteriaceae bacterium]